MIEFVHAIWLAGFAALLVPVLLHVFSRKVAPPKVFPPAVLLEKGGAQRISARKIKELFQLIMRVALLAAVVLAFARAHLPHSGSGDEDKTVPTGLVLVIDDSVSMSRRAYPSGERSSVASAVGKKLEETSPTPAIPMTATRLAEALCNAQVALSRLGSGSEAAAVFASGRSLGPMMPAHLAGELERLRKLAQTSPRADISRALEAAPAFLEEMAPLSPAILVLSDCESGTLDDRRLRELRKVASVAVADLGASGNGDDWGLVSARLDRDRLVAGEDAEMLARVVRAGGEGGVAVRRLELVLKGVAVSWRTVRLAPGAEAEVPLRFSAKAGTHQGALRLVGRDPWVLNDSMPVALVAQGPRRVAVLSSQERLSTDGRAVRLALAAGPGEERKAFVAESLIAGSTTFADLSRFSAFVLIGPPKVDAAVSARLARRVAGGAGLVILADDAAALDQLAVPLGMPVPAAAKEVVRFERGARMVPERAGGSLFGSFPGALADNAFRRALVLNIQGGTVLARIKSREREIPGLVECHLGRGLVLTMASSPAARFSRLTGRDQAGLFVPLLHELVARCAGLVRAEHLAAPDAAVQLATTARERAARFWLYGGPGMRSPLGSPVGRLQLQLAAPSAPGVYRIVSESEGHQLASRPLSVRIDPSELAGLREGDADRPRGASSVAGAASNVTRMGARGRELSPYLAVAALLLLFAETFASFLAIGKPPRLDEDLSGRRKRGRVAG